jgi:hypothetical protein
VLITTHRYIGKLVYDYLKDHLKIELNRRALKYGCMKPDLPFSGIPFSHYKANSFADICEMINGLSITGETLRDKKRLAAFSLRLGIVLHYIADFFCEAHNFHAYDQVFKHLFYEKMLSAKFEQIKPADLKIMLNRFNHNTNAPASSKTTLRQYISERHFEYLNMERNFDTDLAFSLSMCVNVAAAIITSTTDSPPRLIPEAAAAAGVA